MDDHGLKWMTTDSLTERHDRSLRGCDEKEGGNRKQTRSRGNMADDGWWVDQLPWPHEITAIAAGSLRPTVHCDCDM